MRSRPTGRIAVEVPATSANLGVGFDALALALEPTLRVTLEPLGGDISELQVTGEGAGRLGLNESNRFLVALRLGLSELGAEGGDQPRAWRIEMENQIPLGRGLGSSAAATVAGLLCAEAVAERDLGPERLLSLAADIEGHADNVAAALLGGFVVVAQADDHGRWISRRFEPPDLLSAVLFVPESELPTAHMRAVLPPTIPREDGVWNVGRTAVLVAALATGELALLSAMNGDRLHEPYRSRAYPELPELLAAARAAGAFGAALSGAGSTVIALTDERRATDVSRSVEQAADRLGLAGAVRVVRPRADGARVVRPRAG